MNGDGTVVVGVDDTPTSLRALSYAAGVAGRQGRRLVVVHVRTARPVGWGMADLAGSIDTEVELRRAQVAGLRSEAYRVAGECDIDVVFAIRVGDPLRELVAVAAEHRADAVVVGSSTRRHPARSIAARLVHYCGWPVTVVP